MEMAGARVNGGAMMIFNNDGVNSVPTQEVSHRQADQASAHYKYVTFSNSISIRRVSKELVHVCLRLVFWRTERGDFFLKNFCAGLPPGPCNRPGFCLGCYVVDIRKHHSALQNPAVSA